MKKIIIGSLLTTVALYATNGDNMIASDAKSRAMGGVGIATYFGVENTLSNPALISFVDKSALDVGLTYFAPTIKTNGVKSDADLSFIPNLSYVYKTDSAFTYGIGIYGSSGMGVDFTKSTNSSLMKAKTNLVVMKIVPSVAYAYDKLSVSFSPIIQYGSLDISYNNGSSVGDGKSEDFGLGYKVGLSYDLIPSFRLGAVYQSSIKMKYANTISTASTPFYLGGYIPSVIGDNLEQPEEFGVGLSYDINNFTFLADYKRVNWSKADGYKDFGWVDQNVYALGAKYETDGTWLGIGYNHAKSPITNYAGTNAQEQVMNTFNYILFPATQEDHYTFGAGTKVTQNLSLDFNIVYGKNNKITAVGFGGSTINVEHQETSATISAKYTF